MASSSLAVPVSVVGTFAVQLALGYSINSLSLFALVLAVGIVAWVVCQAFINIAAISGLIPLTGIPLPFISFGGTSLAVLMAAVGVLLNKYTL